LVHQIAELPKIEPLVDEYRLHRLGCPQCGATTCGTLPEGVPQGCFGPYLQAVLATLAGGYRLSKRQVQQMAGDLFGLSIAKGMVSKLERQSATVLEAPYNEVAIGVHDASAVSIDDTSWRENRRKAQLWVAVTALTTVFTIAAKRSAAVAKAILGSKPNQVVTSDRHSSLEWIDPAGRQVCWSHLARDFQAMIDRGGAGEATGHALLRLSKRMSRWWHRLRDRIIDRQRFQTIAARLRREVKVALEAGQRCGCVKTAATCFEILKVEEGLWTFARGGDRADKQCLGARAAPCGNLAADPWEDGQRRWQPVRGADADGGRHLPATGAERVGLLEILFRGSSERPSDPLPLAGHSSGNQNRLIPAMPPCDLLRAG
jgi:transposase